ncbi:MAG TPA: pentapeptide repeat-containing protein [Candidatus Dormibacteraeota bacterium]|nr:pentapeptide repeat-containing protein [Candidatus Dormibacteraeota bacterium]
MHSHDWAKEKDSDAFEQEWRATCDGSSIHNRIKSTRDFQGFVFFRSKLQMGWTGDVEINFANATFERDADFSHSYFDGHVDFRNTRFKKRANFEQTRFKGRAVFAGASFAENANFGWTSFAEEATFYLARFQREAKFVQAKFSENAQFGETIFDGPAYFVFSRFLQEAGFPRATFSERVEFGFVTFSKIADFRWANFKDPTQAVFHRINNANADKAVTSGLRLRLVGCLPEDIRFEDVNWNRKNHRIYLQDEADLREPSQEVVRDTPEHGGIPPPLTHELVADAYRRLVNNFEKSRQHEWAEECFLGEMEMRRCNPHLFVFANRYWANRLYANFGWARWLGEYVSLTNFYGLLSRYGSSYKRALAVLAALLLLSPFFSPRSVCACQLTQRFRHCAPILTRTLATPERFPGDAPLNIRSASPNCSIPSTPDSGTP